MYSDEMTVSTTSLNLLLQVAGQARVEERGNVPHVVLEARKAAGFGHGCLDPVRELLGGESIDIENLGHKTGHQTGLRSGPNSVLGH